MAISAIRMIMPVLVRKSMNVSPRDVPIIILGGSPLIVAAPPRLAQKISGRIIYTGLNLRRPDNSIVIAVRKSTTVILSINIDNTADNTINVIKMGTIRYLTALASHRHSHLKNPTFPIPSTRTIIPKKNRIVDQLIPEEADSEMPGAYQNSDVVKHWRLSVSQIADVLRIHMPNTTIIMAAAPMRAGMYRSTLPLIMQANIVMKIITAKI